MTTASKIVYEIQAAYTGRGEVKQLSDDLKSLKQVESFQAMLDKFKGLNDQFVAAKEKMRGLKAEMAKPGNEAMAGEYEKSVAAVNKLGTAIRKQKDVIDGQRSTMRTAGFDLKNLTGEYDRLKQSINGLSKIQAMRNLLGVKTIGEVRQEMAGLTKVYRDAAAAGTLSSKDQVRALEALRKKQRELYAAIGNPPKMQNARKILGLSGTDAEIKKVKEAYRTLAASGKASMRELTLAKLAMGKRIDELRSKTLSWRDAFDGIGSKSLQIGGAIAGTAFPVREAISYETAMAKVGKVVDGTRQQIDDLGDGLQKMTRRIPMNAAELASIAAAGGSLGLAVGDIQSFVDVAARMGTAFDMTADDAGDAIGKLKNIFNLSIPEVETFGDAINKLGNTTATNEKSIVEVMLRVGGTAQQFGLARDKTAALAAAFLSLGKTPETAATGINAMLNKMQTATMQAGPFQEALEKIGMSAEQMAESVAKDPQKAIEDLLASLAELDKRAQSEVLTGLFGTEYQDDIATLVNGMQTYKDALSQVADASSYAGAMNEEFKKQSETTGNQLILLKNAVLEIVRNIGEGLLPAVQKGAEWLTALLKPIADLTARFPELSGAIVAFVSGAIILNGVKKIFDMLRNAATLFGTESLASFGKVGKGAETLSTGATASFGKIGTSAKSLGTIIRGLGGIFAALAVGWEIGTLLNQFGIVQKGMTTLIYWADRLQLGARKMWRALTGGDTAEIDKNIEIARQAYEERLKEIDKEVAGKNKPKEKAPEQELPPKEELPSDEKKKDDSIDGFTLLELEAMDSWDPDKLTEDRKKALEKWRAERKQEIPAAGPETEIKKELEKEPDSLKEEEKRLEQEKKAAVELEQKKVEIPDAHFEPSLLARERSGQLAREKEKRIAREHEAEDERKKRKEADLVAESFSPAGNDEEWQKSLANAKEYEERMRQVHESVAEAGKDSAEEWVKAQATATENAKSAFQKYADKVRSLQDDIAGREKSLAREMDELDIKTPPESKWRRKAKEAKEYEKAAREAMKAGDLDKALLLSDQARELYSSLKSGAGSITAEQARRTALRGIGSTGELGIDIAGRQQRAAAKEAMFAIPPGVAELFGDLTSGIRGKISSIATGQGKDQGKDQVAKVHELKFKDGALRGSGDDMEAFFRALEQAGLSA